MKAGILTLSDKGARGERTDLSGPALTEWLRQRGVETAVYEMIPDDEDLIAGKLAEWADSGSSGYHPDHRRYRGVTPGCYAGSDHEDPGTGHSRSW